MRYLIRTKLILLIGIPIVLTYLVVMAFDILRVRQRVEHETELRMANLVQNYAKQFDAQVARSTRTFVEIHPEISSEQIYAQLRANLVQNYLNEMAAIGNKHGGTLDKFMGVTASWVFSATRNARARCKTPYNAYTWRKPCRNAPQACRSPSASASIAARIEG